MDDLSVLIEERSVAGAIELVAARVVAELAAYVSAQHAQRYETTVALHHQNVRIACGIFEIDW